MEMRICLIDIVLISRKIWEYMVVAEAHQFNTDLTIKIAENY